MEVRHVRGPGAPVPPPDREQLTTLVNAHIQAVVPGLSVSVNTVMSQLERDPGGVHRRPWVVERATLVAEQRGAVVAAAHLLRYGGGEEVGEAYRGTAEINWLLYWPAASHRPDSAEAARSLMDACLTRLESWGAERRHGDGALPAPGVYGLPAQWPHVRALYEQSGFVHDGHVEIILLAEVDALPQPSGPPLDGLRLARVNRLPAYPWPEEQDLLALLRRLGFRELTRTARGWHHHPTPAAPGGAG